MIEINDILGIRMVCPFLEEVKTVSNLLEEIFQVEEVEIKGADYPYQYFGYESVHFLIRIPGDVFSHNGGSEGSSYPDVCEVQVRTILQEAWAEVEHELVYKSVFTPLDDPLKRKLAALNANLTLSDIMFQEIRDYQKSLHAALRNRRKQFYHHLHKERPGDSSVISGGSRNETVDSLLLKALLAHNEGRYLEAVNIYTEILRGDIRKDIRTVIFVHRGMAHLTAGGVKAAMDDFDSALGIDGNNTKALYYRAVISRMKGDFEAAFTDLARCLQIEPYNLEYLTARGETHSAAGNREEAMKDYRTVLSIEPEFKPAERLIRELEENKGSASGEGES